MNDNRETDAWKAFWQRQQQGSSPAVVSAEWSAITTAQFSAWTKFAEFLPESSRLLDVASGNGKLIEMLQSMRGDISATGIDIATQLPPRAPGVEVIGGIEMENLPFDDNSYHAAASQFGFEYGETSKVANEILRVVTDGGPIGLMVHRGDGAILAHNLRRKEQIEWVRDKNSLFEHLFDTLPDDHTNVSEQVTFIEKLVQEGARLFGPGSAAWEIPEAVRRTLLLGKSGSREKLISTLQLIDSQTQNELARIASLAGACARADDREALLEGFIAAGREIREQTEVTTPDGKVIADLIIF